MKWGDTRQGELVSEAWRLADKGRRGEAEAGARSKLIGARGHVRCDRDSIAIMSKDLRTKLVGFRGDNAFACDAGMRKDEFGSFLQLGTANRDLGGGTNLCAGGKNASEVGVGELRLSGREGTGGQDGREAPTSRASLISHGDSRWDQ